MIKELEKIEKKTGENPQQLVIWLHGLGADASDFFILSDILKLPPTLFVFPNAPIIPVVINNSMLMRAWFDITGEDIFTSSNWEQIQTSVLQIENIIAQYLAKGFLPEKITLGGFSQGSIVSLEIAYRNKHKIGKVAGFAGYLTKETKQLAPTVNKPKIFQTHGVKDQAIQIRHGEQTKNFFKQQGFDIRWKQYNIEHTVSDKQIVDLNQFLLL